ncbi:MAG TPA: DUF2059 domain-containing protein [Candidatus Dormibacteraeota bacterium]|jgi:hypothetical protein|nr:DUF2059 domain-containing protein [Candidatus Dormibacteraeota bacterium]
MRKGVLLLAVMIVASPVYAQQSVAEVAAKSRNEAATKKALAKPALPADAPTREDVLKLFDLLQINKTMDAVIQAAKQQSMEMVEQMASERMPDATAEQKKQLHEMMDDVMNQALGSAAMSEMLEATIPVYQRHLTKADLDAMVAFYSSAVGQKILHEQPAMVQESMQAAAGIQQKIARAMFQKIDERMEKMAHPENETKKP